MGKGPAPIGPYMNEDGDWWVPRAAASFREARAEVVSCLSYTVPEEGTLLYMGRERAWLDSEHDGRCGRDCRTNRNVVAWHFRENPR